MSAAVEPELIEQEPEERVCFFRSVIVFGRRHRCKGDVNEHGYCEYAVRQLMERQRSTRHGYAKRRSQKPAWSGA